MSQSQQTCWQGHFSPQMCDVHILQREKKMQGVGERNNNNLPQALWEQTVHSRGSGGFRISEGCLHSSRWYLGRLSNPLSESPPKLLSMKMLLNLLCLNISSLGSLSKLYAQREPAAGLYRGRTDGHLELSQVQCGPLGCFLSSALWWRNAYNSPFVYWTENTDSGYVRAFHRSFMVDAAVQIWSAAVSHVGR